MTSDASTIEIIHDPPHDLRIAHAIFDHDGTISTLREGWERTMEPMMVRTILGPHSNDSDPRLQQLVTQRVQALIDDTTGVQTLEQMQGLVALVREFGLVPDGNVLDIHGCKALYDAELRPIIQGRVERLRCGELSPEDLQIAGARRMLELLARRGVKLYLTSGTDQNEVIAEAEALGYAGLFGDRIFGSVGDVAVDAKRVVLERILRELDGGGAGLVTFGDGPVEIRETRRRGGVAVGVASDEVNRRGLNPRKRERLIRAGAHIIVPDFGAAEALLELIGVSGD